MHKIGRRGYILQVSSRSQVLARILNFSMITIVIISFTQTSCETTESPLELDNEIPWHWCRPIRFLHPSTSGGVAVASYPGSGVTWLRYLLQQVTGVATGSMYPDTYFMKHGFPGDDRHDESVLVLNTHELPSPRSYSKAIILIRDPFEVIVYNFKVQSAEFVSPEEIDMGELLEDKDWNFTFVKEHATKWHDYYMTWLSEATSPIHVVFYEGLKKKPSDRLQNILTCIGFTQYDKSDMDCAVSRKDQFWRMRASITSNPHPNPIDPYTEKMREVVGNVKSIVYREVRRRFMVFLTDVESRRSMDTTNCTSWRMVNEETVECSQDLGKKSSSDLPVGGNITALSEILKMV